MGGWCSVSRWRGDTSSTYSLIPIMIGSESCNRVCFPSLNERIQVPEAIAEYGPVPRRRCIPKVAISLPETDKPQTTQLRPPAHPDTHSQQQQQQRPPSPESGEYPDSTREAVHDV